MDKVQIKKLAKTQDSIDRGRFEKQQEQIAAIEKILQAQRTRWRKKELLAFLYPDPELLAVMYPAKQTEENHYDIKKSVKRAL